MLFSATSLVIIVGGGEKPAFSKNMLRLLNYRVQFTFTFTLFYVLLISLIIDSSDFFFSFSYNLNIIEGDLTFRNQISYPNYGHSFK